MQIRSINIENFRAIEFISINNISGSVVVAGPNGCGKSSIFDAIRLVKSAYGQYSNNEFHSWFSEFQININRLQIDSKRILNNPSKPLKIEIEFSLSKDEIEYIKKHIIELCIKIDLPNSHIPPGMEDSLQIPNPKTTLQDSRKRIQNANVNAKQILDQLGKPTHLASLSMQPEDAPMVTRSPVLELVFSTYQPKDLGVIEYHSPSRVYSREPLGNLNLQIRDQSVNKNAQQALYNTQNKYTGVKTEMAQSYLRELLAEKAGVPILAENTLQATLDELFKVFFTGKQFLGAIPTKEGGLEFPVLLENGSRHDIDDLSSGEKEVLLGYLRLRNNAPKNSIILLDEPELHLNPRLAMGLPRFYQKHLGEAMNNQLWLVSHSDAILREAVQDPEYSVFHMQPSIQSQEGSNQAEQVNVAADLENAIINLVGDLTAYNPRSKVVFLEGENSEFDAKFISKLFPEFANKVNLVSLGSKARVKNAHDILEKAATQGRLDARFYSIVDNDFQDEEVVPLERQYRWDVYHVENFLLDPVFIKEALESIKLGEAIEDKKIESDLRDCARETIDEVVRIRMEAEVNSTFLGAISFAFDPKLQNSQGFNAAISRSYDKISEVTYSELNLEKLQTMESELRDSFKVALSSDNWLKVFRGRNILKRFAGLNGISYEILRNVIISRMVLAEYKPENMSQVITKILES